MCASAFSQYKCIALKYKDCTNSRDIKRWKRSQPSSASSRWYKIIACIMFFLVCLSLAKYPSTICYRLLHFLMDITQLLALHPEISYSLSHPHLSLYSFVLPNLILSSVTERLYPSLFSFLSFYFFSSSLHQFPFIHVIIHGSLLFSFKSFTACALATLSFFIQWKWIYFLPINTGWWSLAPN